MKLRRLLLFVITNIYTLLFVGGNCPCEYPVNDQAEKERIDSRTRLKVCLSTTHSKLFESSFWGSFSSTSVDILPSVEINDLLAANCRILLHIFDESKDEQFRSQPCPHSCGAIPILPLSLKLIQAFVAAIRQAPTNISQTLLNSVGCSLNLQEHFINPWSNDEILRLSYSQNVEAFVIVTLSQRKLMECSEYAAMRGLSSRMNITQSLPHAPIARRVVFGVIIWIGSKSKQIVIANQLKVMRHMGEGDDVIIPWAATDALYPCRSGSTRCFGSLKKYGGFLTLSAVNSMPPGWGCAQRRPLRALSHVLRLFDPTFVVILDDDTFFNLPRFLRHTWPRLQQLEGFMSQAIMVGEMLGRTGDRGHLSKLGMFVGGAGYILNAPLLSALHEPKMPLHMGTLPWISSEISDDHNSLSRNEIPLSERIVGTERHWASLSVVLEGWENTNNFCSRRQVGEGRCMITPDVSYLSPKSIELGVRLVDFCANLLANEHTCMHSDHSLGRCVLYAAKALPINAVCHDSTIQQSKQNRSALPFSNLGIYEQYGIVDGIDGMCFTAPYCDIKRHLTCHRYGYQVNETLKERFQAQRLVTSNRHGYYKVYSSVRNGTFYDTY